MRAVALLVILVPLLAQQAVGQQNMQATYNLLLTGTGRGEECNGSWNVTGRVTVNITSKGDIMEARITGSLRYALKPPSSKLQLCVNIVLSKEGLAPGYTVRFPANATYPSAPIYYTPTGDIAYSDARVSASALSGEAGIARKARVDFHGDDVNYTLTLELVDARGPGIQEANNAELKGAPLLPTVAAVAVTLLTLAAAVLRRRRVL